MLNGEGNALVLGYKNVFEEVTECHKIWSRTASPKTLMTGYKTQISVLDGHLETTLIDLIDRWIHGQLTSSLGQPQSNFTANHETLVCIMVAKYRARILDQFVVRLATCYPMPNRRNSVLLLKGDLNIGFLALVWRFLTLYSETNWEAKSE